MMTMARVAMMMLRNGDGEGVSANIVNADDDDEDG